MVWQNLKAMLMSWLVYNPEQTLPQKPLEPTPPPTKPLPRGIRNNNPGNIKKGSSWQGLHPVQSDPVYCVFIRPEDGIRAIVKILMSYQKKHNIHTIKAAIQRYAPPSENKTETYATYVASKSRFQLNENLHFSSKMTLKRIIPAIIEYENGEQPYSDALISRGIDLAFL